MKRFLGKHRPVLAAFLAIAMLSMSFAIMFTGQDWMVLKDESLRQEVSRQMTQYRELLDEYDNPDGLAKLDGAAAFLAKFGAEVDMRAIFRKAQFVCRELESGGISIMNLRGFLEIGRAIDEILSKNVPMDEISFLADAFGFEEAARWIERFTAILSQTEKALLAYDLMYWSVIAIFGLSILLMLLDTRIGPLLFVLIDALSCAGVMAVCIYVERKSGFGLALGRPAIASFALSAGAMILWVILGIVGRYRRKKQRQAFSSE